MVDPVGAATNIIVVDVSYGLIYYYYIPAYW
jgi:hypothetical protein